MPSIVANSIQSLLTINGYLHIVVSMGGTGFVFKLTSTSLTQEDVADMYNEAMATSKYELISIASPFKIVSVDSIINFS